MRLCVICATKDEARVVHVVAKSFREPCSRCGEKTLFELEFRNTSPRKEKKRIEEVIPDPEEET